ncbi:hypothetical protein ABZT03_07065 [Streptomyces sp. NPDC005574]|uniref:hypothetical protein n=1 Tax=Streptomyces sp. NPDC005574 TaxID=3156891 RepID=UPI0033BA460F
MSERQYLGQGNTTSWEKFWYILGCIYFGAAYLQKVPVKKALSEYGLVEMTGAEKFWYVVLCIFFGAGYFGKVTIKKALSEVRNGGGVPTV